MMRPINADTLEEEIESLRVSIAGENSAEEFKKSVLRVVEEQGTINQWIPCDKRMPKEHDSIFAKLKGTNAWRKAMFMKTSDEVNVTADFLDGTRITATSHTVDGVWMIERKSAVKLKVVAWAPLPEPWIGDEQ